jgi:hypothetical protein
MRHLFFVHSFATYYCSLGIINHLELDGEDCVFVGGRDFQFPYVPEGSKVRDLAYRGILNLGSWRNLLKAISAIKLGDREIRDAAGNMPFHAYIPHSYYHPIHVVISHRLCDGYSYLEEGVTSYYEPGSIDALYPPNVFRKRSRAFTSLLYPGRFPKKYTFFHEGYCAAYGMTDASFPSWERRVVLTNSLFNKGEHLRANQSSSPILVFDGVVELGMTSVEALVAGVSDFLVWLAKTGCGELRYKLHPSQLGTESENRLEDIFGEWGTKLKIHQLDRSASLEDLFAAEDCDVYVLNSAAAIYASAAGRWVGGINRFIGRHDSKYSSSVSKLPPAYLSLIDLIDV